MSAQNIVGSSQTISRNTPVPLKFANAYPVPVDFKEAMEVILRPIVHGLRKVKEQRVVPELIAGNINDKVIFVNKPHMGLNILEVACPKCPQNAASPNAAFQQISCQ